MIPVDPEQIIKLLVLNSDEVLSKASLKHKINGFAYVFEVGQPAPCFYFAINTLDNGEAMPSTGEWDFPADGFEGAKMSKEWIDCYRKLDTYMREDETTEAHLLEVHAIFCRAMKITRQRWIEKLGGVAFTVNECNDSDEVVNRVYEDINNSGV